MWNPILSQKPRKDGAPAGADNNAIGDQERRVLPCGFSLGVILQTYHGDCDRKDFFQAKLWMIPQALSTNSRHANDLVYRERICLNLIRVDDEDTIFRIH